jgi:hypothetical protein
MRRAMSTTTITARDVGAAFRRYERACKLHDIIPEGMHLALSTGSKTYGTAYRVNLTGDRVTDTDGNVSYPHGSGHWPPPAGDDFLGMTRREAYDKLCAYASVIEDLYWHSQPSTRAQ